MNETKNCVECGAPATADPRGPNLYRKYCSDKCMKRANNRRFRRRLPPLASPAEKVCPVCGVTFVAKNRNRRYCYGGECGWSAHYAKGTAPIGLHAVACDGCGKEFTSTRPEARWCSKQCANRYWGNVRARQRPTPSVADYTDLGIFQRDSWRCHICGGKVRRDVDRLHPEGATIDHIVPISAGGADQASNVATAHWRCNREKGARAVNDQLRLI